jgi:hypothetical protein
VIWVVLLRVAFSILVVAATIRKTNLTVPVRLIRLRFFLPTSQARKLPGLVKRAVGHVHVPLLMGMWYSQAGVLSKLHPIPLQLMLSTVQGMLLPIPVL